MGYNLLINGVYWGYNPLTNHLQTSWDIQVPNIEGLKFWKADVVCHDKLKETVEKRKRWPPTDSCHYPIKAYENHDGNDSY